MDIKFDKKNYRKHGSKNQTIIAKSLKECGAGRSVLIDADNSLIAGNGVYRQAKRLGIPIKVVESDGSHLVVVKRTDIHTEDEKRKRLAYADNLASDTSEWDIQAIQDDLDPSIIAYFGIDISEFSTDVDSSSENTASTTPKERSKGRNLHWGVSRGDKDVARCNLVENVQFHFRGKGAYVSSYHRTAEGVPLTEIKQPDMVGMFADSAVKILTHLIGLKCTDDICIITTPRRRHSEWNFADEVCRAISERTGVHYEPDVVTCRTRKRINPEFKLEKMPSQSIIILYDDIVTTGATLCAMQDLFASKNLICVIGICNLVT